MVLAHRLRVGYKYRFTNIEAWRKKDDEWVSMGVGDWSAWFLDSRYDASRQILECHFKDDDSGCDLYVLADTEYHFTRTDDPPKETGRELEDLMDLVCTLDEESDEENNNNNNNNGNGGMNENNGNGNWNGTVPWANENQNGGKRRRPRKSRKQKRKSRKSKKTRSSRV